jgi:photosystem II stability/assembly factor-like uncharacterized protein
MQLLKISLLVLIFSIHIFAQEGWFWQNPLPQGNTLRGVCFIDQNTGWTIGGAGTILKTTNGGIDWTFQASGTKNYLRGVFFTDANNGTVVGSYGIILRTTNSGADWI